MKKFPPVNREISSLLLHLSNKLYLLKPLRVQIDSHVKSVAISSLDPANSEVSKLLLVRFLFNASEQLFLQRPEFNQIACHHYTSCKNNLSEKSHD